MKNLITNYTFDASGKTITFNEFSSIVLERVLIATNVSDNIIIYNFADPNLSGSVSTNVLSLYYNTTTMEDSDKLQIWYEDSDFVTYLDDTSETNVTYIGKGRSGVSTGSFAWQVSKINETSGLVKTYASGSAEFSSSWHLRTIYPYS